MTRLLREFIYIVAIFDVGLWGMYFLQDAVYDAATPVEQVASMDPVMTVMEEPAQDLSAQTPDPKSDDEAADAGDPAVADTGLETPKPEETDTEIAEAVEANVVPEVKPLGPMAAAVKRALQNPSILPDVNMRALPTVKSFYTSRNYESLWTDASNARQPLVDLLDAVDASRRDGLRPSDYHLEALRDSFEAYVSAETPDLEMLARLELIATDSFVMLAAHNYSGNMNRGSLTPNWSVDRGIDLKDRMAEAVTSNRVRSSLNGLLPKEPEYQFLKEQLAIMKDTRPDSEGPKVDGGPLLQKGMTDPRVGQAKQRMQALGFYEIPADAADGDLYVFDPDFREAMVRFQKHVNLQEDGFIGEPDISALNKFHDFRIEQLKANMERWRWLPNQLGQRHIRVNVPNYQMKLWQDGQEAFASDAVVGTKAHATPIFSDRLEYLVFNPSWSVPASIAKRQVVPSFKNDPGIIERNGYVLYRNEKVVDPSTINWSTVNPNNFPYSIRQKPGPTNAMGNVKFMFPNQYAVYLHDSSVRAFFSLSKRSHSSGCVRLRNPMELAYELVTHEGKMTKADIDDIVEPGGKETRVSLKKPVPIHMIYQSVIPDENGNARFLFDIYDLDKRMVRAAAQSLS